MIGSRPEAAEVVLPAPDLQGTVAFFTDRLGFRMNEVHPADDPASALVAGYGLRIRLERAAETPPGTLRLLCPDLAAADRVLIAPNGTRVELLESDPPLRVPPLEAVFRITRAQDANAWGAGRAGMQYRDLVPDRLGGHLIASNIRIPDGGPVADQVHFHKVRFQMIYCRSGWVRVVYQDQGPPFVLEPGDCVLQPPEIRHQVLESSAGCEVVEIACPAEHPTRLDHDLALPTESEDPSRTYGGQRFVRHRAAAATWQPWHGTGFEARDSGIAAATSDLADVRVVRCAATAKDMSWRRESDLLFGFVLDGEVSLQVESHGDRHLAAGDAFTLPPGLAYRLAAPSAGLELLTVAISADA